MKTIHKLLCILLLVGSTTVIAQTTTSKFSIKEGCDGCQTKIESAAQSVNGVTSAKWDKETQMMEVTYDATKTSEADIQKSIAEAGYGAGSFEANAEAAKNRDCCQVIEKKEADRSQQPDNTIMPPDKKSN
ncbi:MAG: heavy metal-associated domain-containing protein [Lentimicrobiaceae bacterium]|nr:heavy metal-associated domain-containing protein [Lentimicrobiaceae bacterium]